jgi:anti-anti-sigma regulatory factor
MDTHQTLPSELTIFTVSETFGQCQAWLSAASTAPSSEHLFALNAEGVVDVDAAGIQLLVALANSLSHRDRQLLLVNPSTVLADACHALGTEGLLRTTDVGETA